jgi:S-formylglutathione hydrolase FrmB
LVDKEIVQQDLPPMLIVMPDSHGAIGQFGDGEYLNPPVGGDQPGTQIATYISRDIPAWTDSHYRTVPSAAGRLIAGESTGGYGAVNLGLQHPDVFGTMISLSGYFEVDLTHFGRALWGPHPDAARVHAESPIDYVGASSHPLWHSQFVYLGNGREDYSDVRKESERMADVLKAAGIPNTYHEIEGHHSWDQWRLTLLDALETVKPRLEAATATTAAAPTVPVPTARPAPLTSDRKRP